MCLTPASMKSCLKDNVTCLLLQYHILSSVYASFDAEDMGEGSVLLSYTLRSSNDSSDGDEGGVKGTRECNKGP